MSQTQVATDGRVQAWVTVRNPASRSGVEVVQLYLRDSVACVTLPVLELKGFERLSLLPGQAARVCFDLDTDAMSFVGADENTWVVEPGEM